MTSRFQTATQISKENPWYVGDQFSEQLNNPAVEHVIRNRWKVFERAIQNWAETNSVVSKSEAKILDLGCGDGINLFGLANILRGLNRPSRLYGCDYNGLRISRAQKIEDVSGLFTASLAGLPIPDAYFDVVLCNHVIEHIVDDEQAVVEIFRILRPGGLAIVGVPNEGCALAQLRNRIVQPSIARTTDHVQFYTGPTLSKKLLSAGFRIISLEREGFFLPHLRWHSFMQRRSWGRGFLARCLQMFPSQAAGLICVLQRPK